MLACMTRLQFWLTLMVPALRECHSVGEQIVRTWAAMGVGNFTALILSQSYAEK